MNYLNKFFLLTIFLISSNLNGQEIKNNKIIFELNNKVYTIFDLEERIRYHELVNKKQFTNFENFNNKEILDDFISSMIFYEYGIVNKILYEDLRKEINNIYENIENISTITKNEINIIIKNLEIDLIRKKIIEDILNSKKNILNKKTNILDLLYNYNVSYIIIKNNSLNNINLNLENITTRLDFENFNIYLKNNKINYIYKTEDILDSSQISQLIKKMINNNKKILIQRKENYIELFSIEKNLVSYEGIFVKLINFKSDSILEEKNLNCEYLNSTDHKTVFKEYEYTKLNNSIKENLKSINDYIYFKDDNKFNYVFLCELRFNEDILKNINLNKKINFLANDIQSKFIKKYKKEFKFKLNE